MACGKRKNEIGEGHTDEGKNKRVGLFGELQDNCSSLSFRRNGVFWISFWETGEDADIGKE